VELRLVSGATAAGRSEAEAGALLDLLAEAELSADREAGLPGLTALAAMPGLNALAAGAGPDLRSAVETLRGRRLGDTLIYLTGPPNEDDLGLVAGLRGSYPSIIAGVFGPVESGLATAGGMLVVAAADGPDFAGAWDGIRAW
jgi:hypothetical protein